MSRKLEEKILAPLSLCLCGHAGDGPNSSHAGFHGHGYCVVTGCGCPRFTWHSWTPFGEVVSREFVKARRKKAK